MSHFYSTKQLASLYDQARRGHPTVIAEIVDRFPLPKDGDILDIGCGTGNETVILQKHAGKTIWAIDKSEWMLNRTKQKLGKEVNVELGDFENLLVFRMIDLHIRSHPSPIITLPTPGDFSQRFIGP